MNIKKTMTIIIIAVALIAAAALVFININFFKAVSSVSPESKEGITEKEEPELSYAIPSSAIPNAQKIEEIANITAEKRKILKKQELEAKRLRDANRAKAFARQKELETSLINAESPEAKKTAVPPLPEKDAKLLSEEEMKALEEKGIISY